MMETTVINGMCRCCATEGAFKDIKRSYHWMGEEEVYGEMLKECFDIDLSSTEDSEGSICEVCITQLRNASNFKKQVLQTEEQFKKQLQMKFFKPTVVKVEMQDENNQSDDNISIDDGFSGPELEMPIKKEGTEESKPKKRTAAAKASTSRAKKSKANDETADTSTTKHRGVASKNRERRKSSPVRDEESTKITLNKKTNFCTFISIKPVSKKNATTVKERQQQRISYQRRLTELDWHFDNIRTILNCSNATPMRGRVGTQFACGYCLSQFRNPADLKSHTIAMHSKGKPDFFSLRSLSKHIVYLDVTGLNCKICKEDMPGLQELMDHLKNDHEELIHVQIKNQIVPFKYEGRLLCTICDADLEQFSDLQDHVKEHFKNYTCEFCSASFMIRCKMIEHKKAVHLV